MYVEYRQLKNDMQEPIKVWKNIERFLADEMKDEGKEKEAERKLTGLTNENPIKILFAETT